MQTIAGLLPGLEFGYRRYVRCPLNDRR